MGSAATAKQRAGVGTEPDTAALAERLAAALRSPGASSARIFQDARKRLLTGDLAPATESIRALIALIEHEHGAARLDVAVQAAQRAMSLALRLGDNTVLRHASSVRGIIASETADLTGAIEYLCAAMEYARAAGDRRGEVVAWVNLASPYLEADLEGISLACGRRGLDLLDSVPEGEGGPAYHGLVSTLNSNVAAAALRTEEYRTGLRAVQRAEKHLKSFPAETINDLAAATETHCNYARLLIALNLLESAEKQVRLAAEYAQKAAKKSVWASAELVRGLLEVKSGYVDAGLKRLHEARALSKEHPAVSIAIRTLAEAHMILSVPERAIGFYRELAEEKRRWIQDSLRWRGLTASEDSTESALARSRTYGYLEQLCLLFELREDSSGQHPYRVGRLAYHLAKAVGEGEDTSSTIERGARIHDLGKIGIVSEVLLRSDELDDAQRQLIQEHTVAGESMVPEGVEGFGIIGAIIRWHHERFDGTGYPDRLRGEAIPLAARIVTIADVFDSLTHDRRRRKGLDVDEALSEMSQMSGLDPMLFSEFTRVVGRLRNAGGPLDAALQSEPREDCFLRAHRALEDALQGGDRKGLPPSLAAR